MYSVGAAHPCSLFLALFRVGHLSIPSSPFSSARSRLLCLCQPAILHFISSGGLHLLLSRCLSGNRTVQYGDKNKDPHLDKVTGIYASAVIERAKKRDFTKGRSKINPNVVVGYFTLYRSRRLLAQLRGSSMIRMTKFSGCRIVGRPAGRCDPDRCF